MSFLDDLQRFPITAVLMIGAVATFIAGETGRTLDHLYMLPGYELSEPWRLVTSIFPHGGVFHLVFNVSWIWYLGRALEARLGPAWMIALTLLCAVVSSGLQVAVSSGGIGLSGVVYAYAFYAYERGRHDRRFSGIVDQRLMRMLVIWFFLCIAFTEAGIMPIANGAHFGGGLMGYALGSRRRWLAPAVVAFVALALVFAQPYLGGRRRGADDLRFQAYIALEGGDDQRAIELYERVFEAGEHRAGSWKNYGIALQNVGRLDDAYDAWFRAIDIDPKVFEPDIRAEILARRKAPAVPPR